MNPFDLEDSTFFVAYLALTVLVVWVVRWLRRTQEQGATPTPSDSSACSGWSSGGEDNNAADASDGEGGGESSCGGDGESSCESSCGGDGEGGGEGGGESSCGGDGVGGD